VSLIPTPFEQPFAHSIYQTRYQHPQDGDWFGTAKRVTGAVVPALFHAPRAPQNVGFIGDAADRIYGLTVARQFCPGGRYLYAAGRDLHQVNNCILLRPDDSREGWATLGYHADMATMTGAGIGVWYGDIRPAGALIRRTGGLASGPMGLMRKTNDGGRELLQGGNRRCAIWAGLPWWHPDIFTFIESKDWPEWLRQKKQEWLDSQPNDELEPAASMDRTNISVTLDDAFFNAYRGEPLDPSFYFDQQRKRDGWGWEHSGEHAPDGSSWGQWAKRVYETAVAHMLKHGEPGFTVDRGPKANEVLRNACTEITSADDSDVCNLGSLVHEFLIQRHVRYGTDDAFEVLEPYMREYGRALEYAHDAQERLGLSLSKGASAIAPNGTIGIVMESTPSADPMFSKAEIRTVVEASVHGPDRRHEHPVIDLVAERAAAAGVPLEYIEDAYDIAREPERRLAQTAYLQQFVDHAISGTANLPAVITDRTQARQMGDTLMKYLPALRGITFYPDGARAGQPRKPVPLEWALDQQSTVVDADEGRCADGVCSV
jgi:ribonucleoside-diphosphate reductase alpha chain